MTEPELEPTNLTETVVRGVGLAGAGYVLAQALTLGFYIVLARLASPQDFGEFSAGSVLVGIGLLFTESGMMAAVIHREDRLDEAASTAVVATVTAGLSLTIGALAASPLIGLLFESGEIGRIAAATSGLLLIRSLQVVPEALLQRRFSFLRRVVVQPIGVVAFGISAIIATSNGLGPWGLVIGFYAAAITDVVLSWALVDWWPKLRLATFAMWRELIGYGRFVLASVAVMRLGEEVPVVLLGRVVGTGSLGQFRYASRMASTPFALIVQAASYVLFPALARISANRGRFRNASLRALRLMCAVGFPLGFLLIPLGVPAATLLFGPVWKQAGQASMILAGFCIGGILVSYVSEVVKAYGHPKIQAHTQIVSAVAATILMLALLPLGLFGVVAGFSLGTIIGGAYGLWKVADLLDYTTRDLVLQIWAPTVASIVMTVVLAAAEFGAVHAGSHGTAVGLVLLAAGTICGFGIYAAALFLLSRDTFKELMSAIARLRPGQSRPNSTGSVAPTTTPARTGIED